MSGSTDKILQALEAEQIRRLNLTKEDLQKSYRKLAEQNFPDDQRIRFIADLGACKDAAYHYRLICKDWKEDKKLHLESSFDQHGREGLAFLFEQLDTVRDEKLKILTAFLIVETLSKLKHRDFMYHSAIGLFLFLFHLLIQMKIFFAVKLSSLSGG